MSRFINQRVGNLKPYTPGEQPKEREYIKLNTNESPFPPSTLAIELATAQSQKLHLYPDPDCKELTAAVAKACGVNSENVILTNGSDEVLNFAFMAYCSKDKPAYFPDITYGFYKVFADVNGVPYREIPLKDDFSINIDDYDNLDGVIFIANPNAPTGKVLPLLDVERLLKANPNRIVVIDQAYIDFGGESAIKLIDKYDNLLVTETFSKSRSMAGARLGYGVASKEIIKDLNTVKYSTNPYNVNRMSAAAGLGAITDQAYFKDNCKKIIENREYTESQLIKLGFTLDKSNANFTFAKSDKIGGKQLYLRLKEKGILVRHFDSDRIKDYIRITIGSMEQMKIFIKKVKEILEKI
ncbi:MAG: histidinol-phosphate transaminase [Clostridia bacterium]|nr:histidinol-phosphate transaminase [Clostridia bacterium]